MRRLPEHDRWARRRRGALRLGVLAALCLTGYGRALGRYFVSEDFFVLRRLAEGGFWQTAWDQLTGPLLGITFVKFYRPVSALLIQVEHGLWGTAPALYHLVHFGLHLASAALVYSLVRAWADEQRTPAAAVAAIFALYPLHANTVVFVAAFATLFSTFFLLASLVLYERARAGGGRRPLAGSLAAFALALGSYEQTVVLPVFLLAREALAAWDRRRDRGRGAAARRAAGRWLPFPAVLLVYFLVRRMVLGEMVAGYAGFRQRFMAGEIGRLAQGLLEGFVRLAYPDYDHPISGAALALAGLFLLLGSLWAVRRGGAELRLWLFGLLWIVATQAPFAFAGVVPGNGRYWYLTSIGLGLLIAAAAGLLARAAAGARPPWRAGVVAAVAGAVCLGYLLLLMRYAGVYAEAGATTRAVQSRLVELADRGPRIFVAGVPDFLRGRRETPIAQVFHWGLNDALRPPFVERGPDVYPLPPFADGELQPVVERADLGTAWRFAPESGAFLALAATPGAGGSRIAVRQPAPGGLQFRVGDGRHRLVLLARGSASVYPLTSGAAADGWADAAVPKLVVDSMRRLYGGAVWAWIEARHGDEVVATSRLVEIDAPR